MANLVKYIGWLSLAALFAGCVDGFDHEKQPDRAVNYRGGYRVLRADFHVHTTFSDGSLTPLGVVRQGERRGLDVFALTEHNSAIPGAIGRMWSRMLGFGAPIVIQGQEVTSSKFHLIAVGVHETVSPNQPLADVIADIHRQGGVAIAAHPVKRYWAEYEPVRTMLDGSEVMHPLAYSGAPGLGWHWQDLPAFYEHTPGLMPIGSSDYHWGSTMGICNTFVFVREPDGREPLDETPVMEALRDRRTVVIDRAGKYYGKPELVALLEKEPIAEPDVDYRYRGTSRGDRVLCAIGFLGLIGLVLFGRGNVRVAWSSPKPKSDSSSSSG